MMYGLLIWKDKAPGTREKSVVLREKSILHMRFLCAEVLREERTPAAVLRRRTMAALKRLKKGGVTFVVLPEKFEWEKLPEKAGLQRPSTLLLRQMIAADWLRMELERKGKLSAGTKVAVSAPRLTGEVVRTVTELILRHRYVLLDLPGEAAEFSRRLRREYGVSLLTDPSPEQLEQTEALVLFGDRPDLKKGNAVVLQLTDETVPLPPLLLPPVLEEQLPTGVERGTLMAVLYQGGVLRPGQMTIGTSAT